MINKHRVSATGFIVSLIMATYFVFVATLTLAEESKSDLPPEAQEAMTRGLMAAEQKAWPQAIEYFEKAREKAPFAPDILFNLGLAHAKSENELPAIAYWKAYLMLFPDASNSQTIQKEIMKLEVVTEIKISTLIENALTIAKALPEEGEVKEAFGGLTYRERPRRDALEKTAFDQWQIGDIGGGIKTYSEIRSEEESDLRKRGYMLRAGRLIEVGNLKEAMDVIPYALNQGKLYGKVASAYLERGDLPSTMKIAKFVSETSAKDAVFESIVKHNIPEYGGRSKIDDAAIAGSLKAAAGMSSGRKKIDMYLKIAGTQVETDDNDGARSSITAALDTAQKMDGTDKLEALCAISIVQAQAKDTKGVNTTIAGALEVWQTMSEEVKKLDQLRRPDKEDDLVKLLLEISSAQAKAQSAKDAETTLKKAMKLNDSIENSLSEWQFHKPMGAIGEAYALEGNVKAAKGFADKLPPRYGDNAYIEMVKTLLRSDQVKKALAVAQGMKTQKEVFDEMRDNLEKTKALSEVAKWYAEKGDSENALRIALNLKDNAFNPVMHGVVLSPLAEKAVRDGDIEKAMAVVSALGEDSRFRSSKGFIEWKITEALLDVGNLESAIERAEALKFTKSMHYNLAIAGIARYLIENKNIEQAMAIINANKKELVSCEIAQTLLKVGCRKEALEILSQREKDVMASTYGGYLEELIETYTGAGDAESATRLKGYGSVMELLGLAERATAIGSIKSYLLKTKEETEIVDVPKEMAGTASKLSLYLEMLRMTQQQL